MVSELETAEAKRNIDPWRYEVKRVRELLQIAQNNLRNIETRQQSLRSLLKSVRTNLLSAQTTRDQLRTQF